MSINRISDRIQRKRLRHAERKLLQAQKRLVRAQRSVTSWTQKLADLRYEGLRAVQQPLWPEEGAKPEPGSSSAVDSFGEGLSKARVGHHTTETKQGAICKPRVQRNA
jgi:hypothetical protein